MVMKTKYLLLFLAVMALRALFALSTGFVDDDSYHWSWTRDLAISYYDHPGMIAWLEYLSTSIFGDNAIGVRLPSFILYTGSVLLVFKMGSAWFGFNAGVFSAAMMLFSPLWGFGGHVASPEQPFIFCWLLAIWIFWQGVREDEHRWNHAKTWLLLGLVFGLGFNSKLPMVLLAPGLGLYLLVTPKRRKDLLTIWPWVGLSLSLVMALTIVFWNIQFDWPSFKYQFSERHQGESFSVARWIKYITMQITLLSPGLYFAVILSWIASVFNFKDPRWRLLFCLSLPSFLVFYPQPFFADFKPHWMGPAYMILNFGVGAIWSQGLKLGDRQIWHGFNKVYFWSISVFLILMNLLIYSPIVYPWVPKVYRLINPQGQWNIMWDPSNELFGWPELGQFALQKQKEIFEQTGTKPFFAASRYETTAQTYMATKEKTWMLSFTRSHYTVTQTKEQLEALKGKNALFVVPEKYPVNPMDFAAFDSCTPHEFKFFRRDELARIFTVYDCRNFQGIKK